MSDNTDIVQRLRGQSVGDYSVLLWEAADEIERLRANLPQLWRTKTTNAKLRAELAQRTAEVAQRTAERDDARTLFCMNHPLVVSGDNEARDVARRHGWDCFDAPHTNATDGRVQNGGA
jgi:hypothetical protein